MEKTNPDSISPDEVAQLNEGKEKLMASAQNVFQKMYESAQAAGGAGPDMGSGVTPDMNARTWAARMQQMMLLMEISVRFKNKSDQNAGRI